MTATGDLSKFSGTYTLTSGTDGSTDAVYTGDNGMYMFYGKIYDDTETWVCSATLSQGTQPTDNVYVYAVNASDIAGAWTKSDSDYTGNVTIIKN